MDMSYEQTASFEHRFWLQILGDHARFIFNGLSPIEVEEIAKAKHFIRTFDTLLYRARTDCTPAELQILNQQAYEHTRKFRQFKLNLLARHLQGEIKIDLSPTFLNHMVNELEEYLRILYCLLDEETPPAVHPVHHHLIWLMDASGHASIISNKLDSTEKPIVLQSDMFSTRFEQFYLKAVELAGFLRTNLDDFPALRKFGHDVTMEMNLFRAFLAELEELDVSQQLLGTFEALMADHMAREECYYLYKLAQSMGLPAPNCDPTKPRVED